MLILIFYYQFFVNPTLRHLIELLAPFDLTYFEIKRLQINKKSFRNKIKVV